jgi:hypothetical protein
MSRLTTDVVSAKLRIIHSRDDPDSAPSGRDPADALRTIVAGVGSADEIDPGQRRSGIPKS